SFPTRRSSDLSSSISPSITTSVSSFETSKSFFCTWSSLSKISAISRITFCMTVTSSCYITHYSPSYWLLVWHLLGTHLFLQGPLPHPPSLPVSFQALQ